MTREFELNRRFHAWLETQAPGAMDARRVRHLRFADSVAAQDGGIAARIDVLPEPTQDV
jgi:hypothetical protein